MATSLNLASMPSRRSREALRALVTTCTSCAPEICCAVSFMPASPPSFLLASRNSSFLLCLSHSCLASSRAAHQDPFHTGFSHCLTGPQATKASLRTQAVKFHDAKWPCVDYLLHTNERYPGSQIMCGNPSLALSSSHALFAAFLVCSKSLHFRSTIRKQGWDVLPLQFMSI
jgi:hypothetical protein